MACMRARNHARLVGAAGLAILAVASLAVLWFFSQRGGEPTDLLPNLGAAAPGRLAGRTGGTPGKPRFYLGFESAAGNLGEGPLVVVGRRPSVQEPRMQLVQQIGRSDGSSRSAPLRATLRYVRSADHSHWHLLRFMRYELRPAKGTSVRRDRKTGFCLGDRYRAAAAAPGSPLTRRFSDLCGKGAPGLLTLRVGISTGWGDNYAPNLEGQEFELTGMAPGRYVLVHRVNPDRQLLESVYDDNVSSLAFELSWPRGRGASPGIDVVARCAARATCP